MNTSGHDSQVESQQTDIFSNKKKDFFSKSQIIKLFFYKLMEVPGSS
jgi:hypothetical protein